ncbi:MAG: hypothetical protein KJ955_04270 [Nanoarchaeota archaeon]|nr:hypothetical protein [Nanoarchaeota archaeon]
MVDEAYIEMRCYIKYNLYYGQSEHTIRQNLIKAGWPVEKINQAFMELKGVKPVEKKAPAAKKEAKKKEPKAEEMPEPPIAAPVPSGK